MLRLPRLQIGDEALTEQELIRMALKGNSRAYTDLFKMHREMVTEVAEALTRKLPNAHDAAQDVIQATFVKGFKKIASYKGTGPFASWLGIIARHEAIALLRTVKRRKEELIREDEGEVNATDKVQVRLWSEREDDSNDDSPVERRHKDYQRQRARDIVSMLPPKYREIYELRGEGKSFPEIQRILNLSQFEVRRRYKRMVLEMRRLIGI